MGGEKWDVGREVGVGSEKDISPTHLTLDTPLTSHPPLLSEVNLEDGVLFDITDKADGVIVHFSFRD